MELRINKRDLCGMQRLWLIDRTYFEDMKRCEETINHYEDMIQSIRKKEYELHPKIKEKESERDSRLSNPIASHVDRQGSDSAQDQRLHHEEQEDRGEAPGAEALLRGRSPPISLHHRDHAHSGNAFLQRPASRVCVSPADDAVPA